MATQNISATVDKRLLKRLDQVVKESERKRSWLISKAVESYLDELEDLKIAKERLQDKRLSPQALRKTLGV